VLCGRGRSQQPRGVTCPQAGPAAWDPRSKRLSNYKHNVSTLTLYDHL